MSETRVTLPEARLATVRRKLVGDNPAAVMEEEFQREKSMMISKVSLFTVTFCANSANDLTCPPLIYIFSFQTPLLLSMIFQV